MALEHSTDWDDDNLPEANTPDGLVPDSWLDEQGIRHIIVRDLDIEIRYRLDKDKKIQLEEIGVF